MTDTCRCLLCASACSGHEDTRPVCERCRGRLRADLASIPDDYTALSVALIPSQSHEHGRSGTRTPPAPARLDVLALRGPYARGNVHFAIDPATGRLDPAKADPTSGLLPESDQDGMPAVLGVLESWERDWRETRGLPIVGAWPDHDAACTALVRFLLAHLDWACDHHGAIDEFADEIRKLRRAMRVALGDRPESIYVGRCPTMYDDGASCGARLYADTWHDWITCRSCGVRRERGQWQQLGEIMRGQA